MPKRTDLKSILIIGAGPIVIGQACEFDYSGAQACKALREEGYRVILVNSNPATIMTDPEMADVTYIEPITWQVVEKIIEKERPDALLPTMGGQTALNCALDLAKNGVLEKYKVEMIGASKDAIDKAEDREKFKTAMTKIGLGSARSAMAHSMEEAQQVQAMIGFPVIIRPSFTMGGSGGGIAYNQEEFIEICKRGLAAHGWQQRVRTFLLDDLGHDLPGDRFDVGDVGHFRVGHDRRRVGIHQDDLVTLFAQGLAGLRAGVVEFAGLTDDDRAGANNQNTFYVCTFRHLFLSRLLPLIALY